MFSTTIAQSTASTQDRFNVDLTNAIPDIAASLIHDSEHSQLPSDIFEKLVFQALNDLVDDFAQDPAKYLKPHHETAIDLIAHEYLGS